MSITKENFIKCLIQSCFTMTVDEFIYNECRQDVIAYLSRQEEEYFTKRGCVKRAILNNKEVIDSVTFEYKKCVIKEMLRQGIFM